MKSLLRLTTLPFAVIGTLAGCSLSSADPENGFTDESATEDALTNPEAYTFFEVTRDLRKCAYPGCGGWFISRLNSGMTKCANGQSAPSCYTPVLDWSTADLIETQQAVLLAAAEEGAVSDGVKGILRGRFARTNKTPRPDLGRFVIGEAWTAHNAATSDGGFVRVRDNGVRCFAPPCPSLTEMWLNNDAVTEIYGMDYSAADLDDYQLSECAQALATSDGMLTAGYRYTWVENGQVAIGRTATAVFMRLTNQLSP
jgi:hypothetical protein